MIPNQLIIALLLICAAVVVSYVVYGLIILLNNAIEAITDLINQIKRKK